MQSVVEEEESSNRFEEEIITTKSGKHEEEELSPLKGRGGEKPLPPIERDKKKRNKRKTEDKRMGQLDNTSLIKSSFIALFVVVGVAFSWACATQFSKSALDLDPNKFYAPYSLVWFSTCFMIVCYPVYLIYATTCGKQTFQSAHFEAMGIFGKNGFTILSLFLRVTPFLLLWIGANYCYSQGLGHIAASAASSIMSSNVAMVCILSWILLREKIDPIKVLAVGFAVAGVVVISLDKEYTGNILGACLVVASALFAAFYKVLFKKFLGDATLGQVSAFMTCLGFMNAFLNIIPTVILVLTNIDKITWSYVPWGALAGNAILSLLFNFLVNFGIALLNPLLISVGMLCGIPVSAIIDILFRNLEVTPQFIIGSFLILISFILAAFPLRDICLRLTKRSKTSYDVTVSP